MLQLLELYGIESQALVDLVGRLVVLGLSALLDSILVYIGP